MRTSRLLIALLVAATILVDVVVLVVWESAFRKSESLAYCYVVGLTFSQLNLTAIWVALGRKRGLWRCSALLAVIIGWSIAWGAKSGQRELVVVGVLLPAQAVFIIGALWLARLTGARVVCGNDASVAVARERP
jgi:hypothetical protein